MAEYSSIKDRLAQGIYVLTSITAIVALITGLIRTPYGTYAYMHAEPGRALSDALSHITNGLATFVLGCLLYLAGWTIRWILTGRTTSLLTYLSRR